MEENQFKELKSELETIKKLLALLLKHYEVKGDVIARAMGVSESTLSRMIPMKKYKKGKK